MPRGCCNTDFPPRMPTPDFLELIPYIPVHTIPLYAGSCRRQHNGQSAKPLTTSGDIPCFYSFVEFHLHTTTDEQHPVHVAHHLHRDVLRQSFNFVAVEPCTHGMTYPPITLLNAKYS